MPNCKGAVIAVLGLVLACGSYGSALLGQDCGRLTAQTLMSPDAAVWTETNRFLTKQYFDCIGTPTEEGCNGSAILVGTQAEADYAKAHLGVDYATVGSSKFRAIGPGKVFAMCRDLQCHDASVAGFVILEHQCDPSLCGAGTVYSVYMHLEKASMATIPAVGQCVAGGFELGKKAVSPEVSWGPHVHLEIRRQRPAARSSISAVIVPGGKKVGYAFPHQFEDLRLFDYYLDPKMFLRAVSQGRPSTVPRPQNVRIESCPGSSGCTQIDTTNWTYKVSSDDEPTAPFTMARWDPPSDGSLFTHYDVTFDGGQRCMSFRGERNYCEITMNSPPTSVKVVASGLFGSSAPATVTGSGTASNGTPVVTTRSAESKQRRSAHLKGRVTPNGRAQTAFEVYLSSGQLVKTTTPRTWSGSRRRSLGDRVRGLLCGQQYKFRLRASPAAGGPQFGTFKSFRTRACGGGNLQVLKTDLVQPTLERRDVECDRIGLSWAAEPEIEYEVFRDGISLEPSDSTDEATEVDFWDTEGLQPGSVYQYKLIARSGSLSAESFLKVAYPRHICGVRDQPTSEFVAWRPRNSTQCDGTQRAALIEWSTIEAGQTTYRIFRGPSLELAGEVDAAQQGPTAVLNDGLNGFGTNLEFRVEGRDVGGTVAQTPPVQVGLFSERCDPRARWGESPPGRMLVWTEPATCVGGEPRVRLHWTRSEGATVYRVDRLHPSESLAWYDFVSSGLDDDNGIVPGSEYIYRVTAQGPTGEYEAPLARIAVPSDVCSADGLPGQPTLFTSQSYCDNGSAAVDLFWYPSDGDNLDPLHRNVRTDLESFGTVNTAIQQGPRFQVTKRNLEEGRTYGYFIQVQLANDVTKQRESNRAYVSVPENVCGLPPAAPTVVTAPPLYVVANAAVLAADVSPKGGPTEGWLQWGESTSYGMATTRVSLGSVRSAISLQPLIQGLQCGRTYHYRGVAQQLGGPVVVGADQVFSTPGCAPGSPRAITGSAIYRQRTRVTLTGTVNANGHATASFFEWGPDGNFGRVVPVPSASGTQAAAVSARLEGLECGRQYSYRLVSTSSAGSGAGSTANFSTVNCSEPAREGPASFFTVTPCRLLDSRLSERLQGGVTKEIHAVEQCGIPATAAAVMTNVTVVSPSSPGHLQIGPRGTPPVNTSVLNFGRGQTRASNAVLAVGTNGDVLVTPGLATAGELDLVIDVTGYFAPDP